MTSNRTKAKAAKAQERPFGVNLCSVCTTIKVCFGDQKLGGVRWCAECIKLSLAWFQLDEPQRAKLMQAFAAVAQLPEAIESLKRAEAVTPDQLFALSIGEARRRLADANAAELRGDR